MEHTEIELYLIRHAQSAPDAAIPNAQWTLSETGKRQADALVSVLKELQLERLVSSPFLRCHQTVSPFANASGIEVETYTDLRERKLAPQMVERFGEIWRRSWEDFDFALEGGESNRQAQTRMVAAIDEVCVRSSAKTIGVASHGAVMGLLANHVNPAMGRNEWEALRNPEIVRYVWREGALRRDAGYRCEALDAFATRAQDTPVRL